MPQGLKTKIGLFMGASFDRLRFRLPDPEPSPVGLANAGFPLRRGRRFFLGLGEEGGGPSYSAGSARQVGRPQPRSASPKPPMPIGESFLTSLGKIQATAPLMCRGLSTPFLTHGLKTMARLLADGSSFWQEYEGLRNARLALQSCSCKQMKQMGQCAHNP